MSDSAQGVGAGRWREAEERTRCGEAGVVAEMSWRSRQELNGHGDILDFSLGRMRNRRRVSSRGFH